MVSHCVIICSVEAGLSVAVKLFAESVLLRHQLRPHFPQRYFKLHADDVKSGAGTVWQANYVSLE